MHWDFKDQLKQADLGGGGTVYYVYDASGQRIRKVHKHLGTLVEERIYLGNYEIYRKQNSDNVKLERETLHIMDDSHRIVLIETRTEGNDPSPRQLVRYQLSNHLGSATLELDNRARIISYEEFYPYGSTSFQAMLNATETPKRYRYTGMERDEETGLCYHGLRYYAPWLGRWTAADPIGIRDDINLYTYVKGNPTRNVDLTGTETPDVDLNQAFLDAIERLDQSDNPFQIHGEKGLRCESVSMDIDEPNPVGAKNISAAEARSRATDMSNRTFLDRATNRSTSPLVPALALYPQDLLFPLPTILAQCSHIDLVKFPKCERCLMKRWER